MGLGSASAAPDGVRTITSDTEQSPPHLLGPDPAKPGWEGRERLWKQSCSPGGFGLQEGGDSRPLEVKGAARFVLGGGQPRGGQQSLVLSSISLLL